MKLRWVSYQNNPKGDAHSPRQNDDDAELAKVVSGYGSVFDPDANVDDIEDVDLFEPAYTTTSRKIRKRWVIAASVAILYSALAIGWAWNRSASALSASAVADIDLLGKSKTAKESNKVEKIKVKDNKKKEKETKKAKEKEVKKEKTLEAEKKKEEEKKQKEKEKEKKEKKKLEAEKKKEVEKKQKEQDTKQAAAFEPTPYPGCETVNITYVKTPLPFWDHEFAANASGCHLASIHSFEENTKLSKDGLFKMSLGPEIAMSFMSGKPLSKVFWIGGYHFESDIDESEWTDDSVYDFGPDLMNATEGCLSSSYNFTEIAIKNLTFDDHWAITDCETPLPAIYKCCIKPLNATMATEMVPAEPAI
jgi:hypothetical protein